MRLAIFIGCLIGIILISRWYTIPPSDVSTEDAGAALSLQTDSDNGKLIVSNRQQAAQSNYESPADTPPRLEPPLADNSFGTEQHGFKPLRAPQPFEAHVGNGFQSPTESKGCFSSPQTEFGSSLGSTRSPDSKQPNLELAENAQNVQVLVRAEYEIPKPEAEKLMQLESNALLEMSEIDSGHDATTTLQITTDEETQKSIGNFLSSMYSDSSIAALKEQTVAEESKVKNSSADSTIGEQPPSPKNEFGELQSTVN